jgi:hypothetical protein
MSVVEPRPPDEGQARWMLLFEMLTIDSLPIAAPMAAWCAIKVGIYGAETGIAAKITVVTPFTPLAICCGERREKSTCFVSDM